MAKGRKVVLKQLSEYVALYRDPVTGIAWAEDGSTGMGHSAHLNIHASGSVGSMKKQGYWRKSDRTVRSHNFIFNIDNLYIGDEYDQIAADYCQCGGKHEYPKMKLTLYANDELHLAEMADWFLANHARFFFRRYLDTWRMTCRDAFGHPIPWRYNHVEPNQDDPNRYAFFKFIEI